MTEEKKPAQPALSEQSDVCGLAGAAGGTPADAKAAHATFIDAYTFAGHEFGMDYLYEFLDEDLEAALRDERTLLPPGMEDILASHTIDDYVWLWFKHTGPHGLWQFIKDGVDPNEPSPYSDAEVDAALRARLKEWAIDNPPHVTWLHEDGYTPPSFSFE